MTNHNYIHNCLSENLDTYIYLTIVQDYKTHLLAKLSKYLLQQKFVDK